MLRRFDCSVMDPGRPAVVTSEAVTSWSELLQSSEDLELRYAPLRGRRVGVRTRALGLYLAQLTALERLDCDVFLVDPALSGEPVEELRARFRIAAIVDGMELATFPQDEVGSGQGLVTIFTSGTTGVPKAAQHGWDGLARPVRLGGELWRANWLLCYRPNLYAGLQVILQCLANGGTLVAPPPRAKAGEVVRMARQHDVAYASATPSYWRWLTTFVGQAELREWPLRQITLGGEIADQRVLDQLANCFPAVRLVHIYATTELGRCFAVSDGLAGFPASLVGQVSDSGVEIRVDEGELLARSANAMRGYDPLCGQSASGGDWFRTGDLVQRLGDRYFILGRKTDVINVGGNKVSPQRVESVVQAVPGVLDAIAFGKRSSIVGELVACEFVIAPGHDAQQVVEAVRRACAVELLPHELPRLLKAVPEIALSAANKKVR